MPAGGCTRIPDADRDEPVPVSPLALLKNPMILMALVALGFTFGMPKLMENSEFHRHLVLSTLRGSYIRSATIIVSTLNVT